MVVEKFRKTQALQTNSLRATFAAIDSLDLTDIENLLQLPRPRGNGWTKAKCQLAILEYKRFLKLTSKYRSKSIIPTQLVDEVWHTHILDTRKYARDCDHVFGFLLHHNPYLGINGDELFWSSAFDQTKALYEKEFGPMKMPSLSPAGCDAADIAPAGCDAADIIPAGCDAADSLPAGCDAADVVPAGCDAADRLAA
jgi:hypothetical protein